MVRACTVYSVPLCTLPRRQRSRPAHPRPARLLIALSPPAGLLSSTAARRAPCHERARPGACLQTIGTSDLRLVNRDRGPPQGVSARSPTDATRAFAVLSLLLLLLWSSYQLRLVPRFSLCPLPVNARQASSSSPSHPHAPFHRSPRRPRPPHSALLKMRLTLVLATLAAAASPALAFFRLPCGPPLVVERVDPIISPGAIAGHVHTVAGGSAFSMTSSASFSPMSCAGARGDRG